MVDLERQRLALGLALFRRFLESDDEPVGSRDVFHSLIGEPKRITLPSGSVCEPSSSP